MYCTAFLQAAPFCGSRALTIYLLLLTYYTFISSCPEVFLRKGVLKICSKFTGERPSRSVISIKLLWHGCSPVNLLHIFRTPLTKNTSEQPLLFFVAQTFLPQSVMKKYSFVWYLQIKIFSVISYLIKGNRNYFFS